MELGQYAPKSSNVKYRHSDVGLPKHRNRGHGHDDHRDNQDYDHVIKPLHRFASSTVIAASWNGFHPLQLCKGFSSQWTKRQEDGHRQHLYQFSAITPPPALSCNHSHSVAAKTALLSLFRQYSCTNFHCHLPHHYHFTS